MNDCYINHVRLQEMLPFSSATNMSRGPTLPMLTGPSHKPIEYTMRNAASKPLFSTAFRPARFLRGMASRSFRALAPPPCDPAARCATTSRFELTPPLNTQIGGREPTRYALFPAIAATIRAHAGKRQVEARYPEPVIVHDTRNGIDPLRLDIENAAATAALRMEVTIATEIIAVRRIGHGDAQNLPAIRQHAQVAIHGGARHVGVIAVNHIVDIRRRRMVVQRAHRIEHHRGLGTWPFEVIALLLSFLSVFFLNRILYR